MKTQPDPDQGPDDLKAGSQEGGGQPPTHRLGESRRDAWIQEQQQMLQELREEASAKRPPLPEGTVALYVLGMVEPLVVRVETEITLGRFDATRNAQTHLDLTPYNAYVLGVSRRHAVIRRQGDALTLTDLESTNGTRVNNKQIVPGQPHPLHNGDEIILGELPIHIYF